MPNIDELRLDNEAIAALINDTLFAKRQTHQGCFVTNVAASELRSVGQQALPSIESAIIERVVPDARAYSDHNALARPFPGLGHVFITYLEIGNESGLGRVIEFLRKLDGPVLAEAILATRSVFRTVPKQAPDAIMPASLWSFVCEVGARGNTNEAEMARLVLKSMYYPR